MRIVYRIGVSIRKEKLSVCRIIWTFVIFYVSILLELVCLGGIDLMFNEQLLLENNSSKTQNRIKMTPNKEYIYINQSQQVGLHEIKKIINFLNSIKSRHRLSLLPIKIILGKNIVIEDKLTYILLECICYHLIVKEKCKLSLTFSCPHNIYNEGIKTSHLKHIDGTQTGMSNFTNHFRLDLKGSHFRRVIKSEEFDGAQTSRTVQDIDSFLKFQFIHETYRADVSNIVGELIDNSLEHSKSDCLIDIDITTDYEKNNSESSDDLYCGVNIVVLNFSDVLLGQGVGIKLKRIMSMEERSTTISQRYIDVLNAKKYHSKFWSDDYSEDDFYTLASFQHKISCRLGSYATGGTGLTQLIRGLEEKSDAYNCYVLSGGRRINFIKSMLTCDENKWVGFNNESDFLTHIPSPKCIVDSGLYFSGTAYNLNFVMKREVN